MTAISSFRKAASQKMQRNYRQTNRLLRTSIIVVFVRASLKQGYSEVLTRALSSASAVGQHHWGEVHEARLFRRRGTSLDRLSVHSCVRWQGGKNTGERLGKEEGGEEEGGEWGRKMGVMYRSWREEFTYPWLHRAISSVAMY